MTQATLSSKEIGSILHPVFDQQIINYGAYNLVFATGNAVYRNPDVAELQNKQQTHFLIGYREVPHEVIVAPLSLPTVSAAGLPTTIDNTNALRAYSINSHTLGLESTNGTSFILNFSEFMSIDSDFGSGTLDQVNDLEDFQNFLASSWLEPYDAVETLEAAF